MTSKLSKPSVSGTVTTSGKLDPVWLLDVDCGRDTLLQRANSLKYVTFCDITPVKQEQDDSQIGG